MDDYLSKPFSQQQLHAAIARWIALPALVQHAAVAARVEPDAAGRGTINARALDAIRALNSERGGALVHKVIHAWVEDTPQRLAFLRQAIAEHDAPAVRKVAHSMKSASAKDRKSVV